MRIIWILLRLGLMLFGLALPLIAIEAPSVPSSLGTVEGSGHINTDIQSLQPGMYVYDDVKQIWNRAREETLRTAACEHIRMMSLSE